MKKLNKKLKNYLGITELFILTDKLAGDTEDLEGRLNSVENRLDDHDSDLITRQDFEWEMDDIKGILDDCVTDVEDLKDKVYDVQRVQEKLFDAIKCIATQIQNQDALDIVKRIGEDR